MELIGDESPPKICWGRLIGRSEKKTVLETTYCLGETVTGGQMHVACDNIESLTDPA